MGTKRVDRSTLETGIGAAIRQARTAASMTQEALASALGVTYQQVQNYERGSVRITASSLKFIADLLDTPIERFFDGLPASADDDSAQRPHGPPADDWAT